jgi:hypothetical protein
MDSVSMHLRCREHYETEVISLIHRLPCLRGAWIAPPVPARSSQGKRDVLSDAGVIFYLKPVFGG